MSDSSVNRKILKGFFWNLVSLLIYRGFDFLIKLVLARLLFPEEFGLVAMAAVFTTFIQVFTNLGFGAAIVQKKENKLNDSHLHTAFWSGIVWSIVLYLIVLFIVSPLAASFYDQPILNSIIPVLSLGILSSPINAIQKAILTRNLDFKRIALINNVAGIFSGILALILAYLGFGVWALVFNSVSTFVVVMPLYFYYTRWTPKLIWKKAEFNEIFGFGIFTTGTNLLNNLAGNIDYLIVGRILNSSIVGAYSLSFMITSTFRSNLTTIINQVMYPIFGKFQDDNQKLKNYYAHVIQYNCILVFPIMGYFIAYSEPFITTFFGDKWALSITPLVLLAIAQYFSTINSSSSIILRGMGFPMLELKIQTGLTLLVYIPLIYLGTVKFGIVGTSAAIIINQIIALVVSQLYIAKKIEFGFKDIWIIVQKPLLSTLIALLVVLTLNSYSNLNFIFGSIIYAIMIVLIFSLYFKSELSIIISYIKKSNLEK